MVPLKYLSIFWRTLKMTLTNCKNHGSGTRTLIISNEEIEDIMKIVESLEESG